MHVIRSFKSINIRNIERFLNRKVLSRDFSEIIVLLSIISYTLVFSYFTILKFHSFRAYAWDLGIFNQSLWATLHEGNLLYSTVELYINPSGHFFGSHFSPILFLVLPVYSLHSAPETLLVFQSFILALGAVPLYLLTRDALGHKTAGIVLVLAYLLYPPLHGVNWFDFHVQAFLPVLFLCTMYFLSKEEWLHYFTFVFLSLSVAENVSFLVAFIGIYCLWLFRKHIAGAVKQRTLQDKRVLIPFITIFIAVCWMVFATSIQRSFFPIDPAYLRLYKAVDNWSVIGVQEDPLKLPIQVILNPQRAVDALTYDTYLKLFYIILLFGPLQFLSFRSYKTVITLAWFVPVFLSNYAPYYQIGSHFPAYIIAFVFVGAIDAIKKKAENGDSLKIHSYIKNTLVLIFLFAIFISPLSPLLSTLRTAPPYFSDYYPPSISKHEELLQTFVYMVPKNASVLTQNNIFPHFSSRTNAYVYPVSLILERAPSEDMDRYTNNLVENSEYILLDEISDFSTTELVLEKIRDTKLHKLYANADGIYLFRREYGARAHNPYKNFPGRH